MSISFSRLGNFQVLFLLNSLPLSLSSFFGTHIFQIFVCFMLSHRFLYPHFKKFFFLPPPVQLIWFLTTLPSSSLNHSYVSSNLLLVHSSIIFLKFYLLYSSVCLVFLYIF